MSTEDEAMMQQIRQITRGGYIEGLKALIVGRSIPTNLVDWISIITIAEEILYNNEDDDDEDPHMNRQQTQKNKNIEDEIWEIVRVIPIVEEKIPCCIKECSKNAAFSWASIQIEMTFGISVKDVKSLKGEDGPMKLFQSNIRLMRMEITIMLTLKLKQQQRPPVTKRVLRRHCS